MNTLTENKIIEYLNENDYVLIEQIITDLEIPRSTINYALKKLCYKGIIEKSKNQESQTGRPKNRWSLVK